MRKMAIDIIKEIFLKAQYIMNKCADGRRKESKIVEGDMHGISENTCLQAHISHSSEVLECHTMVHLEF
jgi:hypothetical protein